MQPKELAVLWGVVAGVVGVTLALSNHQAPASDPAAASAPATPASIAAPTPATRPVAKAPVAIPVSASDFLEFGNPRRLALRSDVALVLDERDDMLLYEHNIDAPRPIASLTKLMTALVVLEANLPLTDLIEITPDDRDRLRGSRSRLPFGTVLTRLDALRAALAASENRAAAALGRTYPGSTEAFVRAMNVKAQVLGMTQSRFADPAGLDKDNVSTARDLVRLVQATDQYALISGLSTTPQFDIANQRTGKHITFVNTNRFVRGDRWEIALSKTGYTSDAGNCLIMRASVGERPVTVVLLNSWGKFSKYADSQRIRDWLLKGDRVARKVLASERRLYTAQAPAATNLPE